MENSVEVLRKLKIELSYVYHSIEREVEISIPRRYLYCMSIAASFIIAEIKNQPGCPPLDEWIQRWHIWITEHYFAFKKK
jgi:hypothetical protein